MVNLINGDCLEEMDKLIEQSVKVDAINTTLPLLSIPKTYVIL